MSVDSNIKLANFTRPGSFSGLMTLYESNLMRFYRLLPRRSIIRQEGRHLVSDGQNDCRLNLFVKEVTTFTTTLKLTYFFCENGTEIADPDLRVRIYHDAGLAEAMACRGHHIHAALRPFDTRPGDELGGRWARNMMFNKWLEYCMDRRHRFRYELGAERINDAMGAIALVK